MEIIVGRELQLTILLDFYVNYGSWNSSTDGRNDFWTHGWLQWHNYKILSRPQCTSREGSSWLRGDTGNIQER